MSKDEIIAEITDRIKNKDYSYSKNYNQLFEFLVSVKKISLLEYNELIEEETETLTTELFIIAENYKAGRADAFEASEKIKIIYKGIISEAENCELRHMDLLEYRCQNKLIIKFLKTAKLKNK